MQLLMGADDAQAGGAYDYAAEVMACNMMAADAGPGGEPWLGTALLFRFLAGILLGVVFVARGLAVCAWLHAVYDVLCVLRTPGDSP